MRIASRLFAVAVFLAGVAVALFLALWPLPVVPGGGYCGDGATSYSAVEIRMHPTVVNKGADAAQDPNAAAFLQDMCVGEANDRLREAAIIFAIGVVVATGAGFAPRLVRRQAGPAAARL